MQYTKTVDINAGDIVECLTPDGWESGKVTNVTKNKITVFMHYIGEEMNFEINNVRI